MLVQSAAALHPPLFDAHSSISDTTNISNSNCLFMFANLFITVNHQFLCVSFLVVSFLLSLTAIQLRTLNTWWENNLSMFTIYTR